MRARSTIAWFSIVGGVILLIGSSACRAGADDDNTNSYSAIVDRNAFHLSAPPPSPVPDKGAPPVLPVVYLSGFMRTGDTLKALLVVKTQNPDAKAAELSSYLTLAEGDKAGVVEMVRIHAGEEKVEIINSGTPMTLSTRVNSVKSDAPSPVASRRPEKPRETRNISGAPTHAPKPPVGAPGLRAPPVNGDKSAGS